MPTAVMDRIKEGAVDPDYLLAKRQDELDAMKGLTHDAEGNKRDTMSDTEAAQWELHEQRAKAYHDEYEQAVKARQTRDQERRLERMREFGEGVKIDDVAISDESNRKSLAERQAESKGKLQPFEHLLQSPNFKRLMDSCRDSSGRWQVKGVNSGAMSLGPSGDFIGTLEMKTLASTQAGADPALFWSPDPVDPDNNPPIYIGPAFDAGVKDDPAKDISILSAIPTEVVTEATVEWLEHARPTVNARNVPEVTDGANVGAPSVKPYSALGASQFRREQLETLAHLFESTTQALNSWPRLQRLIDTEGRVGLLEILAQEVISGDAAGDATDVLTGLLNNAGIATMDATTNSKWDINAKPSRKILSARTAVRTARFAANRALMNAMTLEDLLAEAEAGTHVNPFYDPVTGRQVATVHGLEITETEDAPDDIVIVGAFNPRTLTLFTSGDVDASFTDSHGERFAQNILTWRFELMAYLAVFYPQAFVELDLNA